MDGNRIYRYRKKYLDNYVMGRGRLDPHDPSTYTYYHPLLVTLWFPWQTFLFLVDNYYVNECFFWPTFPSFYRLANTTLVPLNCVLMAILLLHLAYQWAMTPSLPQSAEEGLSSGDRKRLQIEHYLRFGTNWLWILVWLLFGVSFFVAESWGSWLHLVYLLRLVQMKRYMQKVYQRIHTSKALRITYTLTVMFYLIIYFSHFLGCLFYLIDQTLIEQQYFGDPSLHPEVYYQFISMSFTPIEMLSELERYIMAFYFSSGLVTTIAYGDIVGKNYIEDGYVTVLLVLSTIVVAFILEEFMIMVGDNRFAIFEIIKKYKHLKELMIQKHVRPSLQLAVRNYLFYAEYYNKFHNPQEVFAKLSPKLQLDLYFEAYGPQLAYVFHPLGITNIREFCAVLQEVTIQPETPLLEAEWRSGGLWEDVEAGLRADCYWVIKGKVQQYLQYERNTKQFIFRRGQKQLNFYELLTGRRVRYGLRTKSIVQAVTISPSAFHEIIKENEEVRMKVMGFREQLISNSCSRLLGQDHCEVCGEEDHWVGNCPDTHYVIHENIDRAQKVGFLLGRGSSRRPYKRKQLSRRREINLLHFRFMFANLVEAKEEEEVGLPELFLTKAIRSMLEQVQSDSGHESGADCAYDPNGVDTRYSLPD